MRTRGDIFCLQLQTQNVQFTHRFREQWSVFVAAWAWLHCSCIWGSPSAERRGEFLSISLPFSLAASSGSEAALSWKLENPFARLRYILKWKKKIASYHGAVQTEYVYVTKAEGTQSRDNRMQRKYRSGWIKLPVIQSMQLNSRQENVAPAPFPNDHLFSCTIFAQ